MAITRVRQFPFATLAASFAAVLPDFARTEDNRIRFQGQPVSMHLIVNNTETTNYELQSPFKKVLHGIIYNETDDAAVTSIPVTPKSTDPSIAVLTGALTASKNFLVLLIGSNE